MTHSIYVSVILKTGIVFEVLNLLIAPRVTTEHEGRVDNWDSEFFQLTIIPSGIDYQSNQK